MTILFFSRLFYPHVGGVEKHVYNVSQELMKRGYKVIVVTERYNTQLSKKDKYNGITIYRIPVKENWFKKFFIWYWLFNNRKLMQKAKIVHCHDVFYWYFPFRFIFLNKKIYTTFHGYEGNEIPSFKSKLWHKLAETLSKGNICIGSFYEKWYGTKSTFISYGAVNGHSMHNQIIKKKKKYQAVFIGRLEEETGILTYLHALALLKKSKIKILLTVCGDGSKRQIAERFVKKNKLSVQFNGFVDNPQPFVEKADIVFVSRYLAILESLVQKKLVFAVYNNAIKKDYLLSTPFAKYINIASTPQTLAKKLQEVLQNTSVKKRELEQGYIWAKGQTWKRLSELYITLWQQ